MKCVNFDVGREKNKNGLATVYNNGQKYSYQ